MALEINNELLTNQMRESVFFVPIGKPKTRLRAMGIWQTMAR